MKFHVLALGVAATSGLALSSIKLPVEATQPVGLDAQDSNAAASLVGQFRTNASAWLWMRTDLYLHNGVEMRPLTAAEKRAGKSADHAAEGEDLHEGEITTVVPSEEHDFRGIFGDIERITTAYQPMGGHNHNEPRNAMPLFRLMTWLDPQFLRGWTVGASVLGRDDTDAAISYLKEGIEKNPKSLALHGEIGRLFAAKKKDLKKALEYLDKAIAFGEQTTNADEEGRENFLEALRWTALCHRELGNHELRRAVGQYGLTQFPGDPVLARAAQHIPLVLTEKGEKAFQKHGEATLSP